MRISGRVVPGIISARGVTPFVANPKLVKWHLRNGFVLDIENGTGNLVVGVGTRAIGLPVTKEIATFSTPSGYMRGVISTGETTTYRIRAWWTKDVPGLFVVNLLVSVFHVSEGGMETLIASFAVGLSQSETTHSWNVTITRKWVGNERFRVRFKALFDRVF